MTDGHSEADIVFETVDYSNLPVVLSRTTWQAKAGNAESGEHPEVREYLEDVRLTIEKPDVVFQSTRDPRARLFYKLSVGRGRFAGKHLVVVVKYVVEPTGEYGYVSTLYLSRTVYAWRRTVMAENSDFSEVIGVQYDRQGDILTFSFTREPCPAVAEEAADEIWVRYDLDTYRVVTVDFLNFSARVRAAFGPQLTYAERTDPHRLEALQPFKALQGGDRGVEDDRVSGKRTPGR